MKLYTPFKNYDPKIPTEFCGISLELAKYGSDPAHGRPLNIDRLLSQTLDAADVYRTLPPLQAFPGPCEEQEQARGARAGDKREARENDMNECSECPRFR